MTLAPGERQTLAKIEAQLSLTDPALAASFGLLARGRPRNLMQPASAHEQPATIHEPRPGRARLVLLAVLGVALGIVCIVMATSSTGHPVSPRGGYGPGISSVSVPPVGQPAPGR